MKEYLYRGVSKIDDEENNGILRPKGKNAADTPSFGQNGLQFGGGYIFGKSEGNAVRAHQVDSGMKDVCYISTSRNKDVAKKFATSSNLEDGYIYILDHEKFDEFGVIAYELENSNITGEHEVSIRTEDCSNIPKEVIVGKEFVKRT